MVQSWVRRTLFKSLQARGRFRRQLTASTLFNCQTDAKWTSSGTTYFCTDPKLKINRTYKQAKAKVRLKTIHANEFFLCRERKPHGFDVAPFDVQPHALARSCAASLERAPRRACRSNCSRRVGPSKFACSLLNDASSIATDVASSPLVELCMSSAPIIISS